MTFLNKRNIAVTCIILFIAIVACQKTPNPPPFDNSSSSSSEALQSTAITSQDVWLPALISEYLQDDATALTIYPLTLTDSVGTEVTIPAEPQRIISLLPSTTEILCALGTDICSRLVGRDAFSNYPAEVASVEVVGGIFDPNQEKIVAATPDLVFSGKGVTAQAYNQRLTDLGINVIVSRAEIYSEVFEDIRRIGQVINRQEEAEIIVSNMQQEITAVRELVKDTAKPKIVFFFYEFNSNEINNYGLASSTSFIGNLIEQVNGENIITDEAAFPVLSAEQIALLNPDIIITGNGSTADDLAALAGWSSLTAVQERKVFTLSQAQNDVLIRPTPRMVDSIKILASILHPDLITAPF